MHLHDMKFVTSFVQFTPFNFFPFHFVQFRFVPFCFVLFCLSISAPNLLYVSCYFPCNVSSVLSALFSSKISSTFFSFYFPSNIRCIFPVVFPPPQHSVLPTVPWWKGIGGRSGAVWHYNILYRHNKENCFVMWHT